MTVSAHRHLASVTAVALAGLALVAAACGSTSSPPKNTSVQGPIAVGARAPDFQLPSAQGDEVALADFVGKKSVLLFFSMGPG